MSTSYPPIEDLVPHRSTMLLIDELVSVDREAQSATGRVTLTPSSMFVENGRVDALVGVEYMAQTIGAFVGYIGLTKGHAVRVGFLVGIREAKFLVPSFAVGDVLDIEVIRVWGDEEAGAFQCKLERAGELLLTASLQVFREPSEEGMT